MLCCHIANWIRQHPLVWPGSVFFIYPVFYFLISEYNKMPADELSAWGSLLGGFIGAAGSAVGVYATVSQQGKNDRKRIKRSVIREIANILIIAKAQYDGLPSKYGQVNMAAVAATFTLPSGTIYNTSAQAIGDLPHPDEVIAFYNSVEKLNRFIAIYGNFNTANSMGLASQVLTEIRGMLPHVISLGRESLYENLNELDQANFLKELSPADRVMLIDLLKPTSTPTN